MTLTVVKPGLQTTLQGAPFSGHRHLGMPAAGAADCLSLALANHLVGNPPEAIAIELTLDDAKFTAEHPIVLALTGAAGFLRINGENRALHEPIYAKPGDEIHVGPAAQGCRSYLAVSGEIDAQYLLSGQSTYLGAGLGGFQGRALKANDTIKWTKGHRSTNTSKRTPGGLRPVISNKSIIRATIGPEISTLSSYSQKIFFEETYQIGPQTNRMGLSLQGAVLEQDSGSKMKSAPVFPGTIQCPPDGEPFLLGPDAQTTGGYPRVAQVIRSDRHLIGQLRPGSQIQLVQVSNERAIEIYRKKLALLTTWLGTISLW
ncbi:5-oxoprolinase subunit C family protein [Parasphingorhabdus cellanae]|uniref:Biotin-dependent carboxyltransferase n=1 Tax=Parasphingorhabdus cellanae TaxID=2806553 RepID=A0ABX7T730_9SPHN|nr:biotin-dependent carboxyltransferase family protein [Parasphingorhabdus cellanae]QTD55932.1 biotin-dependent carboxyltransferase [Parasphingorhabdus cellanae]